MKDYNAYILPAYAITAAVFLFLIVSSLAYARRWRSRAQDRAEGGDK